jgi:NCAIR mutase (PurE)-related protein
MNPSTQELRLALSSLYPDPVELEAAVQKLRPDEYSTGAGSRDAADVDLQREARCGFPEVIYGTGKPAELVTRIIRKQQKAGQSSLVTRVSELQAEHILQEFPDARYNATARTVRLAHRDKENSESRGGPVIVVTAGSSDRPVAEEAMETLRWMQIDCELIQDAGVAGPQRLQRHVPRLQQAAVIVCIAGMEAALPSVLGGYVGCPVIGVPTSVGYGASMQGVTAMLAMITCCASNVVAVNIDAGFKGGYVAGLIAARMTRYGNSAEIAAGLNVTAGSSAKEPLTDD